MIRARAKPRAVAISVAGFRGRRLREPKHIPNATRARPLDYQPRGWLSDGAPSAAPRKAVRNRRFLESGRPGSNRRRPAWEAFLALAGQGFFDGGSRNGITQYTLQSLQIGDFPPRRSSGRVAVLWPSQPF